jgi:SAM-dependent methyltransferase
MVARLQRLIGRLRELLSLPARVQAESRRITRDSHADARDIQRALKEQTRRVEDLRTRQIEQHANLEREIHSVHAEVRDRLLQYHLQLGRLTSLLEGRTREPQVYSSPIPVSVEPPARTSAETPAAGEWLELSHCPGCGTSGRTIVCKWNKSILRDEEPQDDSTIANYALCHGCGIVYATRRPVGARHRALMQDFPDTIGRDPRAAAANPLLNPYPLSDEDRVRYRRMIAGGIFVSDHERREHLAQVYKDRLDNASHVELLGSLLDPKGARVLEIRSRAGTIAHGLRRQYGATVAVMPIFESQRLIVEELYGIECSDLIDYDQFTIPFGGRFDLIVANHMLTHIVRLDRFFDELRAHLRPGGHLYLYNELDEAFIFASGKSIVNSLNPVHLQSFDRASLMRLLKANGFEVTFIKQRTGSLLCLATFTDRRELSPLSVDERDTRVAAYARGRAHAILRAPEHVRNRFAAEWAEAVELAVAAGIARFDEKGMLRVTKSEGADADRTHRSGLPPPR